MDSDSCNTVARAQYVLLKRIYTTFAVAFIKSINKKKMGT